MRGSSETKDRYSALGVKDVTKELLRQVRFCRKRYIKFRPEQRHAISILVPPAMTTGYIYTCHKKLEEEVMIP